MAQKPSVGRIVHYNQGGECLAAIVTKVPKVLSDDEQVELQVFAGGGTNPEPRDVPHDENEGGKNPGYTEGSWHWPERVE